MRTDQGLDLGEEITRYDEICARITAQSKSEPVTPAQFYRDLFPEGSFERRGHEDDGRPNGILLTVYKNKNRKGNHVRTELVFDDLKQLTQTSDATRIIAPIGYSGRRRDLRHAYRLYALAFDLDDPRIDEIFAYARGTDFPMPTYMAASGHGIHLYYLLEQPMPLYPHNIEALQALKHELTRLIWTDATSRIAKPQYEGINQGFRAVGSPSKFSATCRVKAWKTGGRWDVQGLIGHLYKHGRNVVEPLFNAPHMSLREAEKKYPRWAARRGNGDVPGGKWHMRRTLYDWWLKQVYWADYGHRYFYLYCLAAYAVKCDIPKKELEADMKRLQPLLTSKKTEDPITDTDIKDALEAYKPRNNRLTWKTISSLSGIETENTTRRNGRTQKEHLRVARAIQTALDPDGAWHGRESKKDLVNSYVLAHPGENVTQVARALGVSRPTVYKWAPGLRRGTR